MIILLIPKSLKFDIIKQINTICKHVFKYIENVHNYNITVFNLFI